MKTLAARPCGLPPLTPPPRRRGPHPLIRDSSFPQGGKEAEAMGLAHSRAFSSVTLPALGVWEG